MSNTSMYRHRSPLTRPESGGDRASRKVGRFVGKTEPLSRESLSYRDRDKDCSRRRAISDLNLMQIIDRPAGRSAIETRRRRCDEPGQPSAGSASPKRTVIPDNGVSRLRLLAWPMGVEMLRA